MFRLWTFMSTAVGVTTRSRVLVLYKEILKLGKNWEGKDAQRTLKERKDILDEARQAFRDNKEVIDPKLRAELILEAEKRIVLAQHYGVPYARPDYLPPQTAYSWSSFAYCLVLERQYCQQTIPSSVAKTAQVKDTQAFALSVSVLIAEDVLSDVLEQCSSSESFYSDFVKFVLCNELLEKYPIRKSYRRNLLKVFIERQLGADVSDDLYAVCASCMLDSTENSFRIFLNHSLDEVLVVLRESNLQLCYGSTGLSLWQASCDLSNFLCRFLDLSNKRILELGAGCGLVGIAVARKFNGCSVILSDYDPKVVSQLEFNVRINMDKECSQMKVLTLDWTTFSTDRLNEIPDIILAADVVYDSATVPALCNVLRMCLSAKRHCFAYIASTLRDPLTVKVFRDKLGEAGLRINDEVHYQYGAFTFQDSSKFNSASLFPHSSSLDAPTIIFEVVVTEE